MPTHRTIAAPQPHGPQPQGPLPQGPLPPNRVLDVTVAADEEVEWTWTVGPGGQRYVSGYTIRKRATPGR